MIARNEVSAQARQYFSSIADALATVPEVVLESVISRLDEARWKRQAVFTCGNGGSAATAIHFACDLAKGALAPDKPPIKALSLCENISLVTAWANDASYDDIFAERLSPWITAGDVLIAFSGSGNSPNVLNAVRLARAAGATTIGFTGFAGGLLKDEVDICLNIPCNCMEQIEDVHVLICHFITTCLRTLPQPGGASDDEMETDLITPLGS